MSAGDSLLSAGWALDRATPSESLGVYGDGGVWYWRAAAVDAAGRDVAGTFRIDLSPAELTHISDLAALLSREPDPGDALVPNALQVRIATSSPVPRTFAFSWVRDRPPSAPLEQAWEAVRDLAHRSMRNPVAAIRFSWDARTAAMPIFGFENIGHQALDLLIDPASFRILERSNGNTADLWRGSPETTAGLIDPRGAPIGGILSPARVEPGETARVLFPAAVSLSETPSGDLLGHAEGRLALARPDDPNPFPEARFVLESKPEPLETA